MAFSKSHHYPAKAQITSGFAKAFSHPARLTIIEQLFHEGPMPVELLGRVHPLSQPALSIHLGILRKAHLVEYNEQFPYTLYKVDAKNLAIAKEYLENFLIKF